MKQKNVTTQIARVLEEEEASSIDPEVGLRAAIIHTSRHLGRLLLILAALCVAGKTIVQEIVQKERPDKLREFRNQGIMNNTLLKKIQDMDKVLNLYPKWKQKII